MKFKELEIGQSFTFEPRVDAFPTEVMSCENNVYTRFDRRGYVKVGNNWSDGKPPIVFSVGSINVSVVPR